MEEQEQPPEQGREPDRWIVWASAVVAISVVIVATWRLTPISMMYRFEKIEARLDRLEGKR